MQRRAHFIGICGAGMSAVAKLLRDLGWNVTGSDSGAYPPISDYLARIKMSFFTSFDPSHIPHDVDTIVIGKNAQLLPDNNAEVRAAYQSNARIVSFPYLLGELTQGRHNVVVCGSYGKSTLTALISWILLHAKKDPGYFIGALPLDLPYASSLGSNNEFIIEGDEYPSGQDDFSSKFLHYHPTDVILTSADHDHVNVFPTHKSYLAPFRALLTDMPDNGLLVVCADNLHAMGLVSGHHTRTVTYGVNKGDWRAENIVLGETSSFSLIHNDTILGTLSTTLLGIHNIQNIVGAAAYILERNLISFDALHEAVASFHGLERRLNRTTTVSSVPAYEGFGSSLQKARSAIDAIKLHFPNRRLIVFFEPYTFSWRDRLALPWYDTVFEGCDAVYLYPPPLLGASSHDQLSLQEILHRIQTTHIRALPISTPQAAYHVVEHDIMPHNVVLFLSSGSFGGIIPEASRLLDHKFSSPIS